MSFSNKIQVLSNSFLQADVFDKLKEQAAEQFKGIPTGFEAKLPWLAPVYNISPRIEDYFFRATPIIISDLPNRNGVAFPLNQLTAWHKERFCQGYETWKYAPMFEEHRSDDITKALGVVADVSLRKIVGYANDRLWMVLALAAIDRTHSSPIVKDYESGKVNTVSMGAMVETWTCSYCGAAEGMCHHIDAEYEGVTFYELNGRLVYKCVQSISGYELSIVRDPAYGVAIGSDKLLKYV